MRRPTALLALIATLSALGPVAARGERSGRGEQAGEGPAYRPTVEDRGDQHYRIGAIKVDRARQRFLVRAVVLRDQPPLEFLAITKGGAKAYESLIEVRANAYEFNLACILIGLSPANARGAERHFDPEPVQGDAVDIQVSWRTNRGRTVVDAADLIQAGEAMLPRGQWVYTGSGFLPDGRYLAQADGTLIGFVHDPASIIEHRSGLLGKFDLVSVNQRVAPPVGTHVTLRVERPWGKGAGGGRRRQAAGTERSAPEP